MRCQPVRDAVFDITGTFTNTGVLDLMTWNGTLPAGFVNNGIVLDHSKVKVDSFEKSGGIFTLTITGYAGHTYQLQRTSNLAGAWENVGTARSGNNDPITFTDSPTVAVGSRFYRVMLNP